jgi:hypothetical protein
MAPVLERGPLLMCGWTFAVRASADAWRRYREPVPVRARR